jgi:AcrR family transcriptional regulator
LTASIDTRPLRADAQRNRAKVIAGARKAFSANGLDADMAEVARRAGVGVGTVYRHFPTKDALTIALAADHFEQMTVMTEEALEAGGDPWDAFEGLIWRAAEHTAGDLGMCEVLAQPTTILVVQGQASERLRAATFELVQRAKAAGAMRDDATGWDVPTIMCGFGKIAVVEALGGQMSWRRYLRIALDGMRARD